CRMLTAARSRASTCRLVTRPSGTRSPDHRERRPRARLAQGRAGGTGDASGRVAHRVADAAVPVQHLTPSRNACHAAGVNASSGLPPPSLESRTCTMPPAVRASAQWPLTWLRDDLRQRASTQLANLSLYVALRNSVPSMGHLPC